MRTRWAPAWAAGWLIFAVVMAITGDWYGFLLAVVFSLVNVREFYTQQQIKGLRALAAAERNRADAWEKEHEDLRVLGLVEMNRLETLNRQCLAQLRYYRGEAPL